MVGALRKLAVVMLIFVIAMSMMACRRTDYAENQVYAVMMGVDVSETGMELTVKYPKLAGGSGGSSSGGSGETSAYSIANGSGENFQQALDDLRIMVPRQINLSALTLVVVAEEVLENGRLGDVLDGLSLNYRMYSAAYIAVCEGEASGFIEKQEPEIGSRLSEGLKALIENAEELGNIPDSRVADVYYAQAAVYSDPFVMKCAVAEDKDRTIYAGAYVIKDNSATIKLDERQTLISNVLMGDVKQFTYTAGENTAFISVDRLPSIKVDVENGVNIEIELSLSAMCASGTADTEDYSELIRKDILEVVKRCSEAGAEPFGFADRAIKYFDSYDSWEEYDWRNKFSESNINITVEITEIF